MYGEDTMISSLWVLKSWNLVLLISAGFLVKFWSQCIFCLCFPYGCAICIWMVWIPTCICHWKLQVFVTDFVWRAHANFCRLFVVPRPQHQMCSCWGSWDPKQQACRVLPPVHPWDWAQQSPQNPVWYQHGEQGYQGVVGGRPYHSSWWSLQVYDWRRPGTWSSFSAFFHFVGCTVFEQDDQSCVRECGQLCHILWRCIMLSIYTLVECVCLK